MSDPYIGEIRMFAGTFAPRGWAVCDGQLLQISQYDALFALYGTTYGGDGITTFALPDLRGRIPIHAGTGPGLSNRPLGSRSGAERVTLTPNQLPGHDHGPPKASADTADDSNPAGKVLAATTYDAYISPPGTLVALDGSAVGDAGGNQAHSNLQPFLCINFIVSLSGVFPSRT